MVATYQKHESIQLHNAPKMDAVVYRAQRADDSSRCWARGPITPNENRNTTVNAPRIGILLQAACEAGTCRFTGDFRSAQAKTSRTTKTFSRIEIRDAAITVLKTLSSTIPAERAT
jgi:hypothetical protein